MEAEKMEPWMVSAASDIGSRLSNIEALRGTSMWDREVAAIISAYYYARRPPAPAAEKVAGEIEKQLERLQKIAQTTQSEEAETLANAMANCLLTLQASVRLLGGTRDGVGWTIRENGNARGAYYVVDAGGEEIAFCQSRAHAERIVPSAGRESR